MGKNLLDRVIVANPCEMAWEEMQGDAQKRHCSHCDKHVHNLSQLSRREAENLLRATGGKLCARFERNADGTIRTMEKEAALPRFNQKFLRLAVTTMSAALSLAPTINAKPVRNLPVLNLAQEKLEKGEPQEKEKTAKIIGTVSDLSDGVIPRVKVVLTNTATGKETSTLTNDNGEYSISLIEAGTYDFSFAADGFRKLTLKNLEIAAGQFLQRNVTLRVDPEDSLMGVVVVMPEIKISLTEQPAENMSLQLQEKRNAKPSHKNWLKTLFSAFKKNK